MAGLTALLSVSAWAHGEADDPLPVEAGVGIDLHAAWRALDSRQSLPSTAMRGYLLQGDAGVDPRESAWENASVGLSWRLNDTWGARWLISRHDSDPAHTAAAWVQARWDQDDGQVWRVQLGRMRPTGGPVLDGLGDTSRFALAPLAQRVALDHPDPQDGVQLSWRGEGSTGWNWSADAGLWRGQAFPGDAQGAVVPSLHLGAERGAWAVHGLAMAYRPEGRGARITGQSGHSHAAPVCDAQLTEVLCFDGNSPVLGASLSWQGKDSPLNWPLTLTTAGWLRNDKGVLRSANGQVQYTGAHQGLWWQFDWQARPNWVLSWRQERANVQHTLHGAGAQLLANEAQFANRAGISRQAMTLGYRMAEWSQVQLEWGRERQGAVSAPYVAARWLLNWDKAWQVSP
jgi:hypothetical protein